MAGRTGSTVAHLQARGAGGIRQLGGLGLGREVQGLGGLLRETQRVRDTKGHLHGGTGGTQGDRGTEETSISRRDKETGKEDRRSRRTRTKDPMVP